MRHNIRRALHTTSRKSITLLPFMFFSNNSFFLIPPPQYFSFLNCPSSHLVPFPFTGLLFSHIWPSPSFPSTRHT
ncbi:hypothetical protein E2C01_072693 [Portunus trituberculatus]|uniref:Uncharacterized protein n=1 Tax=Portunus trituberculatus TaxID=210409 RepID=A0A5B7HYQ5_PORTR|nr:hypothetical protein [Portunus trituberculatus]